MMRRTKREWHVAQIGGWWRVYDPEQRTHGGKFPTAEAARLYMAAKTGKPVTRWEPEAVEDVEVML